MGDKRQLVIFKADEQAKITKMVKEMKPDNSLIAFKDLATTIIKATGMLPTKVIPILQQLRVSYSTIRTTIEVGFTSSSVIISEFVIKSWQVMQHGMNKKAQKALMTVGNQLYTIFIDELAAFVESSRTELVQIQSQLLLEATGGRVQNLLDKRKKLEIDLLQLSALLKNKASECGVNQGIIDSLQLATLLTNLSSAIDNNQTIADALQSVKKKFFFGFAVDYGRAINKMKSEAAKLNQKIHDCKNKLEKNRDYLVEKQGSVSRLWQKLRNIHKGDMARNARKNLKKLMERTDCPDENETPECDTNQGISDLIEHRTELFTELTGHLETAKDKLMEVIVKLKEKIHDYKNKIQEYRDRRLEERGSFWIFSWKVRYVNASNSEKIIEENINRLIRQTNFLQDIFQNKSIVDLVKSLLDGKEGLPFYEAKQIQCEQEHEELKQRHDQVSKEFYTVIEELNEIYRLTGTVNVESMKMVDELCRAVQSGRESITSAYTIMRSCISAISVDSDLLVASVLDALQVLNMIDRYLDTTKIKDLEQVLALK
jgi:hypothetical protein